MDIRTKVYIATILISFSLPFVILGVRYTIKHKGLLKDRFNLTFRRNRVVKVNFITKSNRNIERYVVPDKRGFLHLYGGTYAFVEELARINTFYRIPEITLLQSQIQPPIGEVTAIEKEVEVEILQPDGTKKLEKMKVPTFLLTFFNIKPESLNGHIAEEIELALNSHIVSDILTASDRTLKRIELMFILTCISLGAIVLLGLVLISMLNGIKTDLEGLKLAALAPNGL